MPISAELLASITDRLHPGGKPGTAADAIEIWNRLNARFSPLLGPLGAELLFVRTLSEHAKQFPWLEHCATPDKACEALDAFRLCLEKQAPHDIVEANEVLLATYTAQLSDLIGARLAARFLNSAFPPTGADKKNLENPA
jgi:hypothetical protein